MVHTTIPIFYSQRSMLSPKARTRNGHRGITRERDGKDFDLGPKKPQQDLH